MCIRDRAGDTLQIGAIGAGLGDLLFCKVDRGAPAAKAVFQAFQRQALNGQTAAGFALEQDVVELNEACARGDELCRDLVGAGRGIGKLEAAGIRGQTRIQAVRDGGDVYKRQGQCRGV